MSKQQFTDWQPGVVFWRRVTAFAWFALILLTAVALLASAGCVQPVDTEPKPAPIVVQPIEDETPDGLALTVEAEASLVATLHEIIGGSGSVTLNPAEAIVVERPEATLTIKPGTSIRYTMTSDGGRFDFGTPRPRVTAKVWGLKVSPELTRLDLASDNTGTAHVQSGPVKLQRRFSIGWEQTSGATEQPATRPTVTIYTTNGCGYCTAAKSELAGAPFELQESHTSGGNVPAWVQSYPTFHWPGRDGWRQFVGWPGRAAFLEMWARSRGEQYNGQAANVWTFPGSTRAELVEHLQAGQHAGKFKQSQLDAMTFAELHALHADDHEGVVNWQAFRRQPKQAARPPTGRVVF